MANQRKALVVATDRYVNPALRQLAAPAADAAALAEVLSSPELGGFSVDLLSNAQSWEVDGAVETLFTESDASDLLLLHFSCHGIKDERGELFLAASNTAPNRLMSTAVEAAQVSRLMQRSRAQRVVLLLDCCYGGAFERGMVARAGGDVDVADQFSQSSLTAGRGRVVITSSSAMEYAFEGSQLTDGSSPMPSLFTGALVEGIRTGEADRDQDGQVALHELYDYVHDKVREQTPNQTPSKWEFGVQGDLFVARNPRRRIVAGRLPAELVQLAEHLSASMRLAAVLELEQAAAGSELAQAAAARLKLAELESDDSRRVSVAASEALSATSVRVTPQTFDVGTVPAGPVVQLEAAVEGSPLALASTLSSSVDRVDARMDGQLLRISVQTHESGPFEGTVGLTGPAGTAHVTVRGVIGVIESRSAPAERTDAGADSTGATPIRVTATDANTDATSATIATAASATKVAESVAPANTGPTRAPKPRAAPDQALTTPAPAAKPAHPSGTTHPPSEPAESSQQPDTEQPFERYRALIGLLVIAGSVSMALSFVLVWTHQMMAKTDIVVINPSTHLVWLLGLAAFVAGAVPALFIERDPSSRRVGVCTGLVLAAAMWSWVLGIRVAVPALYDHGFAATIQATFETALWLRFLAAVAFTVAGAALVAVSPDARSALRVRRDGRAVLGGLIVFAGAVVLPVGLAWVGRPAAAVYGGVAQVVMIWIFVLPLTVARFNRVQREIALTAIFAFTVFAGARAVAVAGTQAAWDSGTGAGLIMLICLLIGVLVGLLPAARDSR